MWSTPSNRTASPSSASRYACGVLLPALTAGSSLPRSSLPRSPPPVQLLTRSAPRAPGDGPSKVGRHLSRRQQPVRPIPRDGDGKLERWCAGHLQVEGAGWRRLVRDPHLCQGHAVHGRRRAGRHHPRIMVCLEASSRSLPRRRLHLPRRCPHLRCPHLGCTRLRCARLRCAHSQPLPSAALSPSAAHLVWARPPLSSHHLC